MQKLYETKTFTEFKNDDFPQRKHIQIIMIPPFKSLLTP